MTSESPGACSTNEVPGQGEAYPLQLPFSFWLGQVFLNAWGRGQAWPLAKAGGERRSERTGEGGGGA